MRYFPYLTVLIIFSTHIESRENNNEQFQLNVLSIESPSLDYKITSNISKDITFASIGWTLDNNIAKVAEHLNTAKYIFPPLLRNQVPDILSVDSINNDWNDLINNMKEFNQSNKDIINSIKYIENNLNNDNEINCINPSFLGDGFFCQLTLSDKIKREDLENIILDGFKMHNVLFRDLRNFSIQNADIKEIAKVFCDSDQLNNEDKAVCRVLSENPVDNDSETYLSCDGSSVDQLKKDLGPIDFTLFQQMNINKNNQKEDILGNKLLLVQPYLSNNSMSNNKISYLYGTVQTNYTIKDDCKDKDDCSLDEKKVPNLIAAQFPELPILKDLKCSKYKKNHLIPLLYKKDGVNGNIVLEKNYNYNCNIKIDSSVHNWDVFINQEGTIQKMSPQFGNNERKYLAWPSDPSKLRNHNKAPTPYSYKNFKTWNDENKLMQSGIFGEVQSFISSDKPLYTIKNLEEYDNKPEPGLCNLERYKEARMINAFTHLDRTRRLVTNSGLCCSNCQEEITCEETMIDFPSKEIGITTDSNLNSTGDYENMQITLGDMGKSNKNCYSSGDATLISHEFAHIIVGDLRRTIYDINSSDLNSSFHDLADTLAYSYTNEPVMFYWASLGNDIRDLSLENNKIPEIINIHKQYKQHRNDQLFGSIYKSWSERSESECKITSRIRNWSRLIRLTMLNLPVLKSCNGDCSIQTYRQMQRAVMVYMLQMKGSSDEHLMSEFAGIAANHSVELVPWNCIDTRENNAESKYCETEKNFSHITLSSQLTKEEITIQLREVPRIKLNTDNGDAYIVKDNLCGTVMKFIKNSDHDSPLVSETIDACKETITLKRVKNSENKITGVLYNSNEEIANHLPVFGNVRSLKIKNLKTKRGEENEE